MRSSRVWCQAAKDSLHASLKESQSSKVAVWVFVLPPMVVLVVMLPWQDMNLQTVEQPGATRVANAAREAVRASRCSVIMGYRRSPNAAGRSASRSPSP